jgi:hypothetical protein
LIRQKRSSDPSESGRARSHKKRKCLIPRETIDQGVPIVSRETHISDLPPELLVHIFGFLDSKLHKFILPLVCKHWYAQPWHTRHESWYQVEAALKVIASTPASIFTYLDVSKASTKVEQQVGWLRKVKGEQKAQHFDVKTSVAGVWLCMHMT